MEKEIKKELIIGIICAILLVIATYFLKSISEVRCISFIASLLFAICEVAIYYQGKIINVCKKENDLLINQIEDMMNCENCNGHSSLTCSGCKNYSNWEMRK